MTVVSVLDRVSPTPTISTVAGVGYYLFVAYAMFLGALFAAYHMPVENRAFAIFGILAAASGLALGVLYLLPSRSMDSAIVGVLVVSLLVALTIYSLIWCTWGLISTAFAFWRKPPPRLNGWQRIGIVASVVWALGAFVHALAQPNWADRIFTSCLENVEPGGSDRCVQRHHRENLPIALAEQRKVAVANALVPPPFGWLFVYMVLGIVRWVRQGFSPASAQRSTPPPSTARPCLQRSLRAPQGLT
jgi:hypothetical protein